MTTLFHPNLYFIFEINANSNLFDFYNNTDNQYNKMLKQKRKRNKKDKNEKEDIINQYYIDELFENYSYDYSQESTSHYNKEITNISKLKQDLMPK